MGNRTMKKTIDQESQYRIVLRRILNAAGRATNADDTIVLEGLVKDVTQHAPGVTGRGLDRLFTDAARAWEHGNNSGNNAVMDNAKSDAIQEVAERIIKMVSPVPVEVDYPGLYPSFYIDTKHDAKLTGARVRPAGSGHFYDSESLCRAIAEHLKGGGK